MEQSVYIPPIALFVIFIAIVILAWAFRQRIKIYESSSDFRLPDSIPLSGLEIPVLGTYGGIKLLRGLSLSENVFNPRLTLFEDYMEYKILISKTADYSQIKHVRTTSFLVFHTIRFTFNDRSLTFTARVADRNMLKHLAAFFRARNIPVISKY